MGGAVKSVTKPFIEGVQKVAGSLTGNNTAEAASPAPATPVAPAAAPVPALAPQEVPMQRRKRGRAASLLATDSTSAPQTASKALLGQ